MTILIMIIQLITAVVFLCLGYKLGSKDKDPLINVSEMIPKKQAIDEEAEQELSKLDTVLENIENYDGTGIGQKDVR